MASTRKPISLTLSPRLPPGIQSTASPNLCPGLTSLRSRRPPPDYGKASRLPLIRSSPSKDKGLTRLLPHAADRTLTPQKHSVVFQFDRRGRVALDHLEEIAFPPDEMTLAIEIFTARLALLPPELLLLLLNP